MSKATAKCLEIGGDLYVRLSDLILEFQRVALESKSESDRLFFVRVAGLLKKIGDSAEIEK